MKRLAPAAAIFQVSAKVGQGIPQAADWLLERVQGEKASPPPRR